MHAEMKRIISWWRKKAKSDKLQFLSFICCGLSIMFILLGSLIAIGTLFGQAWYQILAIHYATTEPQK